MDRKPKRKRLQDRDLSKKIGTIRPLTPRQVEVLEAMEVGGTQEQAYWRLVDSGKWVVPYPDYITKKIPSLRGESHELTYLNFRQHLINAMGRLQAHTDEEAIRIYRSKDYPST